MGVVIYRRSGYGSFHVWVRAVIPHIATQAGAGRTVITPNGGKSGTVELAEKVPPLGN